MLFEGIHYSLPLVSRDSAADALPLRSRPFRCALGSERLTGARWID